MRCGKPDHQPGQKCPPKNAKCKDCHKIGHFHKVCQSKKRTRQRANLVQTSPQDDGDTHINENGIRQPNPPRVNMFKLVNHIEATKESQQKHLKFPITKHPKGPYKHHIHSVPHNSNSLISNYHLFQRPPSTPKITPLTQC